MSWPQIAAPHNRLVSIVAGGRIVKPPSTATADKQRTAERLRQRGGAGGKTRLTGGFIAFDVTL